MENEVRKLDSPWWNSQICQENSKWFAENVKGVDQNVKEMLTLIEHDGDFLVEKVDSNHPKPELIARIKEISHRHHLLADHYNKLTGEFTSYIQSNKMKNCEKTTFDAQLNHPFLTPEKKLGMHNVEGQVVGSDLSLSSGGGISDATPNEGSESSSLSSDSDSESYNSSPNEHSSSLPPGKMVKHEMINTETEISEMEGVVVALNEQEHTFDTIEVGECGGYEILLRRISEYEKELKVSSQKFQLAEEEIAKLKSEQQSNKAVVVKMGNLEAQLVSAMNQIKLHEAEMEKEDKRSLILQRQIVDLEAELELEARQVQELQESVTKYTALLSDRDLEIQKLISELQDASGNFSLEKWQLESSVSKLTEQLTFHEARTRELRMQCESLADEIKKCEAAKVEMERKQETMKISWQHDIERVTAELCKKNVLVDNLNENLDGLKLKYDILMAEKDEVSAKLQALSAVLSGRDYQIQCLEHNLHELRSDNKRLSAGCDSANKQTAELKSRIDELEKEVRLQAVMISDTAEGKREAIRQLCFTLDHFRSAYEELCNACAMRKRPTAVVS